MSDSATIVLEDPAAVLALRHDLRKAAETLSPEEARYLVDTYYEMQRNRIRAGNQRRALAEAGEPHSVLDRLALASEDMEGIVKATLNAYAKHQELGQWALAQKGIGPVITAGLLAHIDIHLADTAGALWRFAGLDPTSEWGKGEKRPWNAALKRLCWIIGESCVKVSGRDDAYYGRLWAERKAYEVERNNGGGNRDYALAFAKAHPSHAQIATYREGKLPDGHIHSRSKRWTVKLFLAHYWETGRRLAGLPVPVPYPIAHGEHVHKIEPPE